MRIDIFSDPVCPWCFIGKRRLEQALREKPQADLVIRWRAYQLNPGMPAEGMDRQAYLSAKFGGAANAARIYDTIRQAGEAVGLPFDFETIARTPNTLPAHELLYLAAERGDQDGLAERLFRLYFFEGADIGDTEVLLRAAGETGLDTDIAAAALAEGRNRNAVLAEEQQARAAGIQGVPTFILNGHYALSGAQEPKVLTQMFDLAREGAPTAADAAG
jgi:predicted DsbA family dithiol-disulfide isomerase